MWIFMNDAFVSIVEDRESDCGNLLVRARRKGDIQRALFGKKKWPIKVTFTRDRDYPYRASVEAGAVARALYDRVRAIDYSNFKDSIPKNDQTRHDAYLSVWARMAQWGRQVSGRRGKVVSLFERQGVDMPDGMDDFVR